MRDPIYFEGLAGYMSGLGCGPAKCFYERVAFRAPRKGEWYLSGAIVAAYRASNDLMTKYHIVKPTYYAKQQIVWVKGEAI